MHADLQAFAAGLGLPVSPQQLTQLKTYAGCVWKKKEMLNLTSVADLNEMYVRHLADGIVAAAKIAAMCRVKQLTAPEVADVGAGAGYIGFVLAILLPHAHITAIESLEKRCAFMNWAVLQTGLKNLRIQKARLGQGTQKTFDFVTERAMGQLPDILEICMNVVKENGVFIAFQGEHPQTQDCKLPAQTVLLGVEPYSLPCPDNKKRHLALFGKCI
jgi:16S rRNA (guanine527-N7)-methyltransferase